MEGTPAKFVVADETRIKIKEGVDRAKLDMDDDKGEERASGHRRQAPNYRRTRGPRPEAGRYEPSANTS